jgi:hypothetical protein
MARAQRIESLQKRHTQIEAQLHDEEIRPAPDRIRLQELKREKLLLKDEIARLTGGQRVAA